MSTVTPQIPHPPKPNPKPSSKPPNPKTRKKRKKKVRYKPTKKAIRGRRKKNETRFHGAKNRYLPYSFAKTFVQSNNIRTREHYQKWLYEEEICFLTLNPQKYYKEEWIGWNDYLGNNNSSVRARIERTKEYSKNMLPFWDATALAQKICLENNLTTSRMYRDYHKAHNLTQIPGAPDSFYKDLWLGWDSWLGKNLAARVQVQQYQEQYLLIIRHPESNVYQFYTTTGGKDDARKVLSDETLVLVKAYISSLSLRGEIDTIVEENSSEYDENTRFCTNINSIIYSLDTMLTTFRG